MGDIWDILPGLGDKLAAHVVLSASAIGLAMLIALPMAVWAGRSPVVAHDSSASTIGKVLKVSSASATGIRETAE